MNSFLEKVYKKRQDSIGECLDHEAILWGGEMDKNATDKNSKSRMKAGASHATEVCGVGRI